MRTAPRSSTRRCERKWVIALGASLQLAWTRCSPVATEYEFYLSLHVEAQRQPAHTSSWRMCMQLISSRSLAQEDSSAGEELQAEPSAATPIRGVITAASPSLASTPSTEALLSRAFSATGHGGPETAAAHSSAAHPISTLTSSGSGSSTVSGTASEAGAMAADGAATGHALRNDRSRPDLQEAVDAALRRNHSQQQHQQQSAAQPAAAVAPAAVPAAVPTQPRPVAAAAGPAAPQDVPPLRLVPEEVSYEQGALLKQDNHRQAGVAALCSQVLGSLQGFNGTGRQAVCSRD